MPVTSVESNHVPFERYLASTQRTYLPMKKVYVCESVTFGSNGKAWIFQAPRFEYKTPLPGGVETAHKVARVVNGALKRTNGVGLDNLGRANIHSIVTAKA